MIVKVIEIRDRATFIPAVAMQVNPWATRGNLKAVEQIASLCRSVGFNDPRAVILMKLGSQEAKPSWPHWESTRTMQTAHKWIEEHFDEIEDGQVVDVEFILGEAPAPAKPQRMEGW